MTTRWAGSDTLHQEQDPRGAREDDQGDRPEHECSDDDHEAEDELQAAPGSLALAGGLRGPVTVRGIVLARSSLALAVRVGGIHHVFLREDSDSFP